MNTPDLKTLSEGRKDDSGKILAGILYEDFPHALTAVAEVASFGAKKYARGNWKNVLAGRERYNDAMHRHLLAHCCGEKVDTESELLHLAHAAWNALAVLELTIKVQTPQDMNVGNSTGGDIMSKTNYASLLNTLCEMQESPMYAARKGVLADAENTILQLEKERDEYKEELRKAREQEPVAWMHDNEGRVDVCHDSVKKLWIKVGQKQNTQFMREIVPCKVEHYNIPLYAEPKPAAYGVDDATAQHIALAVYDYQNRISDEPLMHVINRILAKEAHSITPKPAAPAVPEEYVLKAMESLTEIQYFHECSHKHRAWAWDALSALSPEIAMMSADSPQAAYDHVRALLQTTGAKP